MWVGKWRSRAAVCFRGKNLSMCMSWPFKPSRHWENNAQIMRTGLLFTISGGKQLRVSFPLTPLLNGPFYISYIYYINGKSGTQCILFNWEHFQKNTESTLSSFLFVDLTKPSLTYVKFKCNIANKVIWLLYMQVFLTWLKAECFATSLRHFLCNTYIFIVF